jgi:hypothetical protein
MKKKRLTVESPFMTRQEAADYFCVSYTTVRYSRGDFAVLRRTTINGRVRFYRDSVEELKALLDKRAYSITEKVENLRRVRASER